MENKTLDGAGERGGGEISEIAKKLGRLGGLKRAEVLSRARRFEIAQKAGKNRWGKGKPKVKYSEVQAGPASQ